MEATNNIKPSFFGSSPKKCSDSERTILNDSVKDPESTLATVMMTQLYDANVQIKFNRLMLMAQNNEVSKTYPLNRKVTHVGRSRSNHVSIKDPLVSTKHLTVSASDDTCVINDFESSNGTFINGERLDGGRVLKDGDEIMLGKTVLRFAARQQAVPELPSKVRRSPIVRLNKKRFGMLAAALILLVMSAAFTFLSINTAPKHFTAKALPLAKETLPSSEPTSVESPAPSELQTPPMPVPHIEMALAEYADGQLDSAMHTLKMLSVAGDFSPEALQAKRMLSMISAVQELHTQALINEKEKKFANALECWDRLLVADMELIGNRPSFFAIEAEQRVQILSFDYALDALRSKNHKKAKQLCQAILQINPDNPDALALMSRIDPRA